MIHFGGLGVALVTPFNNSGDIDFVALKRLVNFQINQKVDYLVVLGTTAETATLSTDEKISVLECVKEVNQNRVPIVLGLGSNDTRSLVAQLGVSILRA